MERENFFNCFKIKILVIVLCHIVNLICGDINEIAAQSKNDQIKSKIVVEGFENVSVISVDDTLRVFYENRRYRFEPRGMASLIKIVDTYNSSQLGHLDLILLNDQVPMLRLIMPFEAYNQFINNAIDEASFFEAIFATLDVSDLVPDNTSQINASTFKIDLPVIPNWSAKFGNFDNPVESNINFIPELHSTLARGLTLKAQLIIPIQNDFFFVSERETIRPGNITLNQFASLEDNFYIIVTAGFFNKNRAGFHVDFKKLFREGNFEIGANVGYTGYYSFTGIRTEFYDKQKYLTAILNAQYRYNPYDIVARLEVGNFLFNVPAARFEVLRQFGQVKIGFFALATKDDYDGGFRFAIPLSPRKYTKLRIFRVRPNEFFAWEYRAKGFPQNGVQYQTGYNLTDKLLDFNPDFVKKRLIIEIKNIAD